MRSRRTCLDCTHVHVKRHCADNHDAGETRFILCKIKICSGIRKTWENGKKYLFFTNLHAFICQLFVLSLPPQNLKMQKKPQNLQSFVDFGCVVACSIKLFLYGNIVSINSTFYGVTYGLHGEKKTSVSCTKDTFFSVTFVN